MADAVATPDITTYLAQQERKELLRFLTAGNVDDGKSTLIGRLLYDTQLIYEDQLAAVRRDSERKGTTGGEIDLSLLMDGLKAEREQGITIDVAYRYFSTSRRKFIIADCPGHEQYTRNMATGASNCDLAIILIDARHGVQQQTRRHSFIVSLLGIKHVVVAINKMDLVGWSEEVFERIKSDYTGFATRLEMGDLRVVPISALKGDNIVDGSTNMPWYQGETLLHLLETVHIASDRNLIDLRFPVQYVNRPNLDFRGFCGTVASGVIREGDEIAVLPSNQRSRVKALVTYEGTVPEAFPPMAVTVVLEDEIDVSRGSLLVHPNNVPRVDRAFEAMLVWMAEEPMAPGRQYLVKQATNLVTGTISKLHYRVDVNTLHREEAPGLAMNEVGRCTVTLSRPVAVDPYRRHRTMGAFIVIDRMTNRTVGAGMVLDRRLADDRAPSAWDGDTADASRAAAPTAVGQAERAARFGQQPVTVLFTGLEAAGKTTLASALERRLFDAGRAVALIDGTQLRQTITRDLGFTYADRSENVRRAADVARFLNDAGLIALCALMAPDAAVRAKAREAIGADRFLLVHVATPLAVCRERDARGVYARAESGELGDFPGVSAPYDVPTDADIVIDTSSEAPAVSVDRLMALLEAKGILG